MKNKIISDSNIWIALLNINDSCFEDAKQIFEDVNLDNICISEYVFLEVCIVLKQKQTISS